MTKKNWIIIGVTVLALMLIVVPGITYLVRHGQLSGVTLSTKDANPNSGPPASSETEAAPTSTATPTATATPSDGRLNAADQKKLEILKEIFASRNDNDPRMDTELVHLSPELKAAMVKTYQALPTEKRNERGTVAFLIGREIKTNEDVDFLKSVLMEKPCLSLTDCTKPATASTEEDVHLDGLNETTANYPQLMAIRQMVASYKKLIDQDASSPQAARVLQSLRDSLNSPNPRVTDEARRALQSLGKD
jgi:hypothetical protein